jgi:acyl dehydratase
VEPSPGERIPLGDHHVTREEIVEFGARWDPQPFHLSEALAAGTPLGELVASGVHVLAVFQRLACIAFFRDAPIVAGRGFEALRLHRPVRPGTTLTGSLVIDRLELRPDGRRELTARGMLHARDDLVLELTTRSVLRPAAC